MLNMAFFSESASKLFSRSGEAGFHIPLDKNLFPHFTSQDIVEISGEAGSGKTELLYHCIACCIFPPTWKDLNLDGLEAQVTFIDNDCHFNLFRLVTILEQRIQSLIGASKAIVENKECFLFIQDILKRLYIVKCYNSDDFILTLKSLENTMCSQKCTRVLMIDGISSFYWSDKSRVQNNFAKLASYYRIITDLIIKMAKTYGIPCITTRRKLLSMAENDKKVLGPNWKSNVCWRFEIEYTASLPEKTLVTLFNHSNFTSKLCSIKHMGFVTLGEKC